MKNNPGNLNITEDEIQEIKSLRKKMEEIANSFIRINSSKEVGSTTSGFLTSISDDLDSSCNTIDRQFNF